MNKQRTPRQVSITVFLLVAIGGLVAVAAGAVLIVSGYSNFKNTRELVVETASLTIDALETDVRNHVLASRYLVEHLASLSRSGTVDFTDKRDALLALKAALAAAPQLTGVALWQSDGRLLEVERLPGRPLVVKSSDNSNNAKLMAYLGQLKAGGQVVWNPPFRKDGISFVSVATPVHFSGQYAGVVATGIALSELSAFVTRISGSYGLQGFILYGDDHVLAHKKLPDLSTRALSDDKPLYTLAELGDPVLAGLGRTKAFNERTADSFELRDVKTADGDHIILSRKLTAFDGTPWTIGVHGRLDQLNVQFRRLAWSIAAGVALLVLALVAAVFLARRIAAPIMLASSAASQIGQMNLDRISALPGSRFTELNNQALAFNQMLDGLKWFGTYVPRSLVNRLIQSQGSAEVTSREQVLTVMFTDIVGYTAMSEALSPAETANLLNSHFEVLNRCIEAEGGTLDKYIGDAVMAFWGAPEDQDDHALRACRTALAIRDAFERDSAAPRVKIALHTGPLIVGNIGATGRMNYTVIGDTVNTCSRIEKLAGELDDGSKVSILMSMETAEAAGTELAWEAAGEFTVKGRRRPVKVVRLTDSA